MSDKSVYPNSWEVVKLGKIAESEKGKKPKNENNELTETFCYPYIDIEAFEKLNFKTYTDGEKCVFCDENDFLMVWDGSRSGLVGKGVKGALGSTLVRIKLPKMNNRYAYYFLQSKYLQINTRAKGSGTPHVDPDLLWNYDFPIPPLNEQNRIVTKIEALFSEIDNGIDSLSKAKFQLEQYRQSLLKSAFEGKLTEQWRADYEKNNGKPLPTADELLKQIQDTRQAHYDQQLAKWELAVKTWEENGKEGKKPTKPSKIDDISPLSNTDNLPKVWRDFYLSDLSEITGGLTKNGKRNDFEEKAPYLRVANVYANKLLLDEISYIGIQEAEKARTALKKGDLLVVEGNGSIEQIGRVAMWDGSIEPCYHQNHLIKSRTYAKVNSKYILYFLMSATGRKRIVEVASSTTGLHTLSLTKVSNLVIPYPSEEEQVEIVSILDQKLSETENVLNELNIQTKKAEILKSSILQKAFQGKLVPQDDNDPPASNLLEQIKQEREQALALIQEAKQAKKADKPKTTKRTKKAKTTENQ